MPRHPPTRKVENAVSDPTPPTSTPNGIPVDRSGGPTIDPTKNVLDLVAAANQRTDDLRQLESRSLRDLIERDNQHLKEIMALRAAYDERLDMAEAKRIDAIRLVDVNAVAVAAERAAAQAGVLAAQVSTSAETQRALVATSAAALAEQLTQIIKPITDRLAVVERASYEGAGKTSATDPAMAQLSADMRETLKVLAQGSGSKQGVNDARVWVVGAIAFIGTVFGIVMAFV